MDTVSFNLLMLVVDFMLLWGMIHWGSRRWWLLACMINFAMIGIISKIFRLSWGQNILDGICWHFGFFLIISAAILFFYKHRIICWFSFVPGLLLVLLGIDVMLYEPYALTVEHYRIVSNKVDRPVKIVFVADPQTDRVGNYERRVFRVMNEQNADIVILGGDYLQAYKRSVAQARQLPEAFRMALIREDFKPPLGAYAIYGNNETGEKNFHALFKETGFESIYKTKTMDLGPIVLTALSLGDSLYSKKPKFFLKEEEQKKKFHVLVGHYPTYALGETDGDLCLAGHTHGGQVVIPFYGAITTGITKVPFPKEWVSGLHQLPNGKLLLVTRGSGMERGWAPEIRFCCKPEVSVIEIVPE